MKNLYTLLSFILFVSLTSFGQGKVNYDTRSRFYLGFNVGATYHTKTEVDLNNMFRGGGGFTFGYSFGMKPDRLLSLDLQLCYLLGSFKGASQVPYEFNSTNSLDVLGNGVVLGQIDEYNTAYGKYAPNFHTWVNDWSLELKLNTNRLRENTGWNLFVLGGIGYNRYTTHADFYDANSSQIKYESDWYDNVVFNDDYESKIVENIDWMPSFGVGLERQITPNSAFTLMGRTTWTRNNDFDGLTNSFSGQTSGANDKYHYVSAGIKFYLGGRHNTYVEDDEDPILDPNPPLPVTGKKPVARFTVPNKTPINLTVDQYSLLALVQNVVGKQDITFTHNGKILSNYAYNANTDQLNFSAILTAGQNIFTVTAINDYGRAEDQTVIIYTPITVVELPEVTITKPGLNNITVANATYNFEATVLHVSGKQNISIYINGNNNPNFNYNGNSKQVTASLTLLPGKNIVTITGTNTDGSDSETTTIIYRKVVTGNPPIVTIITPSVNPLNTSISSVNVVAKVINVSAKSNIKITVNGVNTNNFSFNTNDKTVRFNVSLLNGSNSVIVKGTNQFGHDLSETTIIYKKVVSKQPPVVSITNPGVSGSAVSTSQINIIGKVLFVNQKNNISVVVNGSVLNNFSYNFNNKEVKFLANLVQGSNTVQIIATNIDGQDQANTLVIYQPVQIAKPPVVNIYSPLNGTVVNVPNVTVQGNAMNVSSKNNVTVLINGQSTSNFNFNTSTQNVTLNTNLQTGNNTIQIIGSNADGQDQAIVNIVYNKPVVKTPPVVAIIDPSIDNKVYTVGNVTVKSTVLFVSSANDINVKLNGNNIYNFSFNANTKLLTIPISLVSGTNTLLVTGSNSDGTDTKQRVIRYKKAVTINPPTVNYINPGVSPITVNNPSFSVKAITTSIASKNQIELKQNGTVINSNGYSFVGSTLNYSSTLVLGNNIFEVTVTNNGGTDSKTTMIEYKKEVVPCTKPTIGYVAPSPNSTVTVANQNIEAQINNHIPGTVVTLKLNGASQGVMSFNQGTQIANKNVSLKQGVNTLEVTVTNSCGINKSTFIINYNYTAPCKKPVLVITSSNQPISAVKFLLKGNVTNIVSANQVVLKLNGVTKTISLTNGIFTANLTLNNGLNTITLKATNNCGFDSKAITIVSNQCKAPNLVLINPLKANVTVTKNSYSLILKVTGDVLKGNVVVRQNGVVIPFSFNASTKQISVNASNLKNGLNTISVAVNNNCGSDNVQYKITANLCSSPLIKLNGGIGSSRGNTVSSHAYKFIATVTGMKSKTGISVLLNGKAVGFTYNASTGQLLSNMTLKEGSNAIVVSANNTCGTDSKTQTILAKTCVAPTLKSANSKIQRTTQKDYQKFSFNVTGVTSQSQITVKLNGKVIGKRFTNGLLSFTASGLKIGVNTISVTVASNCGTDQSVVKITRKICSKPAITQKTNATQISSLTFSYSALVSGIASKSNVVLKVNNKVVAFNFNTGTKLLTASLVLKSGANTIVLTATNSCGTTTKTHTITMKNCKDPQIKVGYPTNTNITTANSTFSLLAIGINVVQNEITVTNNGKNIPFTFTVSNGKITVLVANMTSGANNIIIKGTNPCGTSQVTYAINYTGTVGNRSQGKSSPGDTKKRGTSLKKN